MSDEKRVLIWSGEQQSWWRANASGYCAEILGAGTYTPEEAKRLTSGLGPEKQARIRTAEEVAREVKMYLDHALRLAKDLGIADPVTDARAAGAAFACESLGFTLEDHPCAADIVLRSKEGAAAAPAPETPLLKALQNKEVERSAALNRAEAAELREAQAKVLLTRALWLAKDVGDSNPTVTVPLNEPINFVRSKTSCPLCLKLTPLGVISHLETCAVKCGRRLTEDLEKFLGFKAPTHPAAGVELVQAMEQTVGDPHPPTCPKCHWPILRIEADGAQVPCYHHFQTGAPMSRPPEPHHAECCQLACHSDCPHWEPRI